jgi:outer membrane immunogenic protein
MKKFLLAGTAFAGLTASAFAADLPRRAAPPVFTPVPVFTWTGFYAGFNAGYGFSTRDDRSPTVLGVPATGVFAGPAVVAFDNRNSTDGFVGGGQIGYNYQFTPGSGVVVGVEADAQYVDFGRNRNRFISSAPLLPGALAFNPSGISGLDYFGTVRGRLGYAFDRTLVYATGGFAYGSGGGRDFGLPNGSRDEFQTGYAVGGGVEFAITPDSFLSFLNFFRSSAVTFKIEGLYVNLDRGNRNNGIFAVNTAGVPVALSTPGVVLAAGNANLRRDTEFAVVRAGVNYKFGTY